LFRITLNIKNSYLSLGPTNGIKNFTASFLNKIYARVAYFVSCSDGYRYFFRELVFYRRCKNLDLYAWWFELLMLLLMVNFMG